MASQLAGYHKLHGNVRAILPSSVVLVALHNLTDMDEDGEISRQELLSSATAHADRYEPLWHLACLVLPIAATEVNTSAGLLGATGWPSWPSCDLQSASYWANVTMQLMHALEGIPVGSRYTTFEQHIRLLGPLADMLLQRASPHHRFWGSTTKASMSRRSLHSESSPHPQRPSPFAQSLAKAFFGKGLHGFWGKIGFPYFLETEKGIQTTKKKQKK